MRKAWMSAALAPALALLASPLWAQQRTPTTVVACSGAFAKNSSHLKLAMFFDSKNIAFTNVDASGIKVPASVLFPNDPKRRLEVWWSNITERKDIHLIVIGGQSTWTAPGGLRLGQTLEQVEKLNHKPFKLKGFDRTASRPGANGTAEHWRWSPAAAKLASACAPRRGLQTPDFPQPHGLKRSARFQPTRNTVHPIRQFARQSRRSARFSSAIDAQCRGNDPRRFPPPWSVEELDACFVVREHNAQGLVTKSEPEFSVERFDLGQ
jgi:hypothetical protein